MNFRGQAALEYLMTYGWALVIIVVVAGILFFIMSSPASGVTCISSDPAKMPVQSSNILASGTGGTIKVINGTAGTITLTGGSVDKVGLITGTITPTPSATAVVNGGGTISITAITNQTTAVDTNAGVMLQYSDQFGYVKTVRITCQGKPQ